MRWHKSGTFHRATATHGHASIIQHKHKNWTAVVTVFSPTFETKKQTVEWAEEQLRRTEDDKRLSDIRALQP